MEEINKTERRRAPRWKASRQHHKVGILGEDGKRIEGTILDISRGGIGLRAGRSRFALGMQVGVVTDLSGETVHLRGTVRFVDRFSPRIGLQIDTVGPMEAILRQAESCGFLLSEVRGGTLAFSGSLTLAALRELEAARGCREIDLSRVGEISIAGASLIAKAAERGARIACCSGAIAPVLDSLGICGAGLCVSRTPCDLPKAWSAATAG